MQSLAFEIAARPAAKAAKAPSTPHKSDKDGSLTFSDHLENQRTASKPSTPAAKPKTSKADAPKKPDAVKKISARKADEAPVETTDDSAPVVEGETKKPEASDAQQNLAPAKNNHLKVSAETAESTADIEIDSNLPAQQHTPLPGQPVVVSKEAETDDEPTDEKVSVEKELTPQPSQVAVDPSAALQSAASATQTPLTVAEIEPSDEGATVASIATPQKPVVKQSVPVKADSVDANTPVADGEVAASLDDDSDPLKTFAVPELTSDTPDQSPAAATSVSHKQMPAAKPASAGDEAPVRRAAEKPAPLNPMAQVPTQMADVGNLPTTAPEASGSSSKDTGLAVDVNDLAALSADKPVVRQHDGSVPVAHAAPVPERPVAEANIEHIVTSVRGELLSKGGSMQIRLDPPTLGTINVQVTVNDGVLTASLQTENEQATRMLSHNLTELKSTLEAAGVTVDRIQVKQAPANEFSSKHQQSQDHDRQQNSAQDNPHRQEQQRREMLQRMWRKLALGGDPLDLVA